MPVKFMEHYTRQDLRDNPHDLYVFGDNFSRMGYAGQARECRCEPNAIGIATKRAPSMSEAAFLTDADFYAWDEANSDAFNHIEAHLISGGTVVFPSFGLGTGLAQLAQRAPKIWAELQVWLDEWKARYGTP